MTTEEKLRAEIQALREKVEELEGAIKEARKTAKIYCSPQKLQGPSAYMRDPHLRRAWQAGMYDAAKPIHKALGAAIRERKTDE